MPKKEVKYLCRHNGERERAYVYLDPIPVEMRQVVIMELCAVPIDWKMLTILRPKSKIEEDYYSKYTNVFCLISSLFLIPCPLKGSLNWGNYN